MKLTKKKVFVMAIAISLIAILSFSTLAWFTDSEEVKNEFMIAKTDDDTAEDIFDIDLWENTPDGDDNQDGYEYDDVLPDDILKKEVNIQNTGYYDQYVRVTVKVSDAGAWMTALGTVQGKLPELGDIVTDYNPDLWECTVERESTDPNNDYLVYTLYYIDILKGDSAQAEGDVVTVFKNVHVPKDLTREQAVLFDNNFKIDVKAEAVQTKNVGVDSTNTTVDAIEAFAYVAANS